MTRIAKYPCASTHLHFVGSALRTVILAIVLLGPQCGPYTNRARSFSPNLRHHDTVVRSEFEQFPLITFRPGVFDSMCVVHGWMMLLRWRILFDDGES
jgi:hypothetical protein